MEISKKTMHKFILNRNSLGNKTIDRHDEIKEICRDLGILHSIDITDCLEQADEVVEKTQEDYESGCFYAAGGDGTLHHLINNVDLDKYPVQILPFGTGNDAYTNFYQQHNFDLKKAIYSTQLTSFDLGIANGEYFIDSAGINLDAKIAKNLDLKFLLRSWKLAILYTIFRDVKAHQFEMIYKDIKEEANLTLINIANAPYEGGGVKLSPNANPRDGLLNIISAEQMNSFQLLHLLSKVKSGAHLKSPLVKEFTCADLTIKSPDTFFYQLDGEIKEAKTLKLKIKPGALTLKGKTIEIN